MEQGRFETGARAEDLGIGMEPHLGAPAIGRRSDLLQGTKRRAPAEILGPQRAVAGDLDAQAVGQRIDHRDADSVQAARNLIGVAAELAAGMQGGQNDLEGAFVGEARVRIDRDAPAVVAHADGSIDGQIDIDDLGIASHRLVHGVIKDFRHQMMEGAFVGSANVHAGAPTHRFKPFQHFDAAGGIGVGRLGRRRVLE